MPELHIVVFSLSLLPLFFLSLSMGLYGLLICEIGGGEKGRKLKQTHQKNDKDNKSTLVS